jgi:hypothetical protein
MREHEFYAHPTLFDEWHATVALWLCRQNEKFGPYAWVAGFAFLGAAMLVISAAALAVTVHASAGGIGVPWNQSLAQGVSAVVALATAQAMFRQALGAWPQDRRIPQQVRDAARFVGWQPAPPRADSPVAPSARKRPQPQAQSESLRAFFTGVRNAGVNVSIAKALFIAGIRSPAHLRSASDQMLVSIPGVGPATVRKLRAQFGS